ncbi:hypothetical protein [Vibrio algarum]|uniref:Uncharacterized protein n=1 Tax=Vibrio algarum TaxID=3020714 RepID=A0ABT4YT18_9VIBR|nr:hypothetical protein [Vibrio sp. KJ40-1]MDB1124706.1 hypothetical protein [Vibrio sp. KJ40-1]
MKYLQYQWKSRLAVVLAVSVVISVGMVMLDMTDWATQINQQGYSHGEGDGPDVPSALMYILPFVKEIVLIGVPMSISLLLMRIFGRKKRSSKVRR